MYSKIRHVFSGFCASKFVVEKPQAIRSSKKAVSENLYKTTKLLITNNTKQSAECQNTYI